MPSVLVVCTSNLERSPLACARLRQMVEPGIENHSWRIESAGTWALQGQPVPSELMVVGREVGLDLSTHKSRCVTRGMLRSFNLILTMEHGHKEALRIEFPEVARRVFLLSEMTGLKASIGIPLHRSLKEYRQLVREIDEWLKLGYNEILRLA